MAGQGWKLGTGKRPGAAAAGVPLPIFADENKTTPAKSVTLKALGLRVAGFEDDAKVQFLVEDPKGEKIRRVTHAFVGEKVLPLKNHVYTSTVHGHANAIRGWMVDFNYISPTHKDGTEVVKWLTRDHNALSGTELEEYFETKNMEGLWKAARKLVDDSPNAPRVRFGCAQVCCRVATQDGRLACLFDGEGDTALEDAIVAAARQTICNKATYLPSMKTNEWFLFLPDDLQRDAILAKEGKRFDHATFEGHAHVTTANPPGTRVVRTKKKGDKWEYIDASGVWRKANDRADAAEKALKNPRIREIVRRMEELEKNLRAYDVKYGNATDGFDPACLPPFFQDRDNRDGRGFNSKMFDVLYEALVTFNARLQEAGFPEDIVFGGPGEGGLLGFLCGNMDFTKDADLAAKLSDLLKRAADEEATTNVPALDRLQQLVKEEGVDVDIFEDATGYRPTEDQMKLIREWCELTTVLHKKATTRASLIYTLKLVKKAGDMESNVWTTNSFSRYFYALAVHNQIGYAVDTTIRLNFQAWFERKYGVGVTPLDLARGAAVAAAPATAAVPMDVDADEDDDPACMAAAIDEMDALPTVQARMDHFKKCMAAMSRRLLVPVPKQKRAREPVVDDDSPSPSPAPAPAPKKKKARKKKR